MTKYFIQYSIRASVFLLLALMAFGQAQPPRGGPPSLPKERLQRLRIAYYSDKLNLTPTEAQRFWPVYNAFSDEMDGFREERRRLLGELRREGTTKSDKELEAIADKHIELLEKEVALQKRYHSKFKEVLPILKVLELYKAEKEFPRWLLKQIRTERRERREGKGERAGGGDGGQ